MVMTSSSTPGTWASMATRPTIPRLTSGSPPVNPTPAPPNTDAVSTAIAFAQSQLGDPVLILDDVFAELDTDRRARLAGMVKGFEQVIVTAAVEEDVPPALRARTVRVVAGTIEVAHE